MKPSDLEVRYTMGSVIIDKNTSVMNEEYNLDDAIQFDDYLDVKSDVEKHYEELRDYGFTPHQIISCPIDRLESFTDGKIFKTTCYINSIECDLYFNMSCLGDNEAITIISLFYKHNGEELLELSDKEYEQARFVIAWRLWIMSEIMLNMATTDAAEEERVPRRLI